MVVAGVVVTIHLQQATVATATVTVAGVAISLILSHRTSRSLALTRNHRTQRLPLTQEVVGVAIRLRPVEVVSLVVAVVIAVVVVAVVRVNYNLTGFFH